MIERKSWHEYFMEITELVASRSTCLRRQIGAIAVKDKRIIATGYNGAPSGMMDCIERGICIRDKNKIPSGTRGELCYASHSEMNLLVQAAKNGFSLNGADVYCTHKPCAICTRLLIGVGIRTVYYKHNYPDSFTDELVAGSSIKFINYNEIAK